MAIHERLWDCQSCGTTGNLGRYKSCPQCGAQRPTQIHFYKPEHESAVTDPELLKLAQAGPDWTCEHCGQDNPGNIKKCQQCGAKRGSSPKRPVIEYGPEGIPQAASSNAADSTPPPPPINRGPYQRQPSNSSMFDQGYFGSASSRNGIPWKPIVIGTAVLALLVFIGFLLFAKKDRPATVTGFYWTRTIAIQQYKTVSESGWSIPAGGRETNHERKIRSYNKVPDGVETKYRTEYKTVPDGTTKEKCGETDLGNGFSEDKYCTVPKTKTITEKVPYTVTKYKKVPVYDTWYTYNIDKWVFARNATANGTDQNPYWPTLNLGSKEREGSRQDSYTVHFTFDKDKQKIDYPCPQDEWRTFRPNQHLTLVLNGFGAIVDIKQ